MSRHSSRPFCACWWLVPLILFIAVPAASLAATADSPATAPSAAVNSALEHVQAQRVELGLSAQDLADVKVVGDVPSRHSGARHVYLTQRLNGIDIYNASMSIAVTADGHIAHVGDRFVRGADAALQAAEVRLGPVDALMHAAEALELGEVTGVDVLTSLGGREQRATLSAGSVALADIPARLIYQPLANGALRLAWDLEIQSVDTNYWWSVRVDAESGRLLDKTNFVDSEQYMVYPLPIRSPQHTTPVPPADARQVVVDPYTTNTASPFGWHDTDGVAGPEFTITRGNNTHTYADRNADNGPDGGVDAEPDGGGTLNFTGGLVPLDLSQAPSASVQAAIANLFYWTNIIHDVLYDYGFDEASGNFQVNNYGNGGLGNDDVRAEAQDGAGNCNANFGTPSDGSRPRMQMFTCTNANPARDGSYDHEVVIHEYGHGVSNRLTGGPAAAGCLGNTEQMGEGWSDYLALVMTMLPGDQGTDSRGMGTYLFGQPADGPGIRNAPYSTDFGVNSFTYSDISGVSIPHGVGFVWATMLWDMTWNLVDAHGFNADIYDDWSTGGNNLALQLVMDGMKLQPCGPGFVDGRDAILAADNILTGDGTAFSGANQCLIWDAFADRGLGFAADQGSSNSVGDGTEDFTQPDFCATLGSAQDQQNICQGDTASFRIGAGIGFTAAPVTLSASGEPAGTTASFTTNPIATVPGISDLEITNTGSAAAGDYTITVTGTDTTPTQFQTTVDLSVFDSTPGTGPTLMAPSNGAVDEGLTPTFQWQSIANTLSYTLEVDDDSGFGSIDYTVSGLTGTSHTAAMNLDYGTTYYWRVRGDNACGAGVDSATFSFTTLTFPGDCPAGAVPQSIFSEDMESGAAGWTSSGSGDTWAISTARANSGISSFHANDPESESDQRLISPVINLPVGANNLTLQFHNYQLFETPNTDGRCWDAGVLEISTNGGSTWSQVPAAAMLTDPYDDIIWNDTPGNNPITDDYGATDAWCDVSQPWGVPSVVDLSAYSGAVQFAWRLGSDSAAGNEGWYIDDVVVQSCFASSIFADGFESEDTAAWSSTVP